MMEFVHGDYRVSRAGDIVLSHAYGPWNSECVSAFGSAYNRASKELHNKRWADVVVLEGESLLIPDAEARLRSLIMAARKLGLAHVALVMGYSTVKSSTQMQLERMYRQTGIDCQFFDHYLQATAWLESCGYNIDAVRVEAHFQQAS